MSINLGALLSTLVAFQLMFMAIYLFTHKKGNRRNNRLLGFLFLIFSLSLVDFIVRVSEIPIKYPLIHLIDDGFFFLYGPIIYFYVKGVVYRDFELLFKNVIHVIPFIAYFSYICYHLFLLDAGTQDEVFTEIASSGLPKWFLLLMLSFYAHILCYLWFSWKSIEDYQSYIKDAFSSIERINLEWLDFMVKAFALITVVAMINNIVPIFETPVMQYASLILLMIISFVFINRVIVKALNQPAIFSGITLASTKKYASSNLSPRELSMYKTKLIDLMEEGKVYLNPELSSKELAGKMNISTKYLSQLINQGFNKNFFDFVNTYRCEEVKRLLNQNDRKRTISEAMYEAGFNSKSSFNKEFKKLTGKTPSEFKRD